MKIKISELTFLERRVLQKILGKTEMQLGLGEIDLKYKQYSEFLESQKKLRADYPLDYILGEVEFLNRIFTINDSVLIPREETEYWIKGLKNFIHGELLVDMGTGSGIIGISLANNYDDVLLVDVSEKVIEIASENISRNDIHNCKAMVSDLFDNKDLVRKISDTKHWDLIANLPYLPEPEKKYRFDNNVSYEPEIALYSGVDGLELFRKMMVQISQTSPPKNIYLELDISNVDLAAKIIDELGYETKIKTDIYGINRFIIGQR